MSSTNGTQNPIFHGLSFLYYPEKIKVNAVATTINDRYWLALSSGNVNYNNVIYVLCKNGKWNKLLGFEPKSFVNYSNSNYFMDSSGTSVVWKISDCQYDQYKTTPTISFSTITALWESKELTLGDVDKNKEVNMYFVTYISSSAGIQFYDYAKNRNVWNEHSEIVNSSGVVNNVKIKCDTGNWSKTFKIKLYDTIDNPSYPFKVFLIDTYYNYYNLRE